ncbi:hypothetical protein CBR_g19045 [Chara braunii]|uniref:Myb-like domain-containing protein n=1 Tax=Chara braunii TaxID=69332 RepID=A0A388KX95_CHABU|nr:hypothetical protein CBR_g19045 [Chara braunii]|eukprot:GBG74638.1 hypothetical protein CBR_g19045 [Chara braunii]
MQGRAGVGAGQGGIRPATTEPPRRYDPSMYAHLQSWEMPLPPSDEEPEPKELPTLPLASGSTQLWSQTARAGGSGCNEGGEYTSLLQQGLGDDDDGGLDLRFSLCSGGSKETSRTLIIDTDPSPCGVGQGGSQRTDQTTLRARASVAASAGPSAVLRRQGSTAPSADRSTSNWLARNGAAAGSPRVECARPSMPERTTPTQSDVRDAGACRPPVRPVPTVENITRGVSNMRAHSDGGDDADERLTEDVDAGDEDEDIPVRPLGKTGGRGRARSRGAVRGRSVGRGGRGCVSDDAGKSVTYWSPEEQLQLVRCKREQEMHLAGLGHNYGRMRTKDWKWDDIAKRMASAAKPKDADDCMKKWDNLFQNYKKIQQFQNASGRPDFFGLTNEERKEHNFKFRMESALYNEIHAGMLGNHTIFPPNIADTGNPDGVQLPRRGGGGGESVGSEAGGEGFPEERSYARELFTPGRGSRRPSAVHADVARQSSRHGASSSTIFSLVTDEDQGQATASGVRESGGLRQSDHSASKRLMTPPPETKQVRARDKWTNDAHVDDVGDDDDEPLERRLLRSHTAAIPPPTASGHALAGEKAVTGRLPATTAAPRPRNTTAEGGSVQRGGGGVVAAHAGAVGVEAAGAAGAVAGVSGSAPPVPAAREEGAVVAMARDDARGEKRSDREGDEAGSSRPRRGVLTNDLIDRAVLWVDNKPFWTTGEGRRLYNIVHETREDFVAIAGGLPPPAIPRSVVMPKSSTRIARIADPSQLQQATSRASTVENIALRVLHGWVFKSANRPRGYNLAFQYALESMATDIARAMWYGEEWCNIVSPAVCAHTIDLSMDLPLWFAGMKVENRPDDDDMAAYQESTIICVAHAFRAALQMGAVIDGEFISHDRLCRVVDCFGLLLAACMWIMRMSGDDPRSHFEVFHFATLVSKPTLVASMHRSFDHRRYIRLAVKAVT